MRESPGGTWWVALIGIGDFKVSGGLTLLGKLIVSGNEDAVKDCITVMKGGEDSVQDNTDASEVMARLPGGVVMLRGIGEALTEIMEEEYEGLEAGGLSLGKKDADTLKVTAVSKFDDEEAAGDATDQIKDDLEGKDYEDINVDRDKEFVKVTGEIGIDDFVGGGEPVTITIGELTDFTGPASSALIPVHSAMMDVARYYNDENLIPGVKIKVVVYDNRSDPARDVPGYEWCKERGAELIIALLSTTAEILRPFADKDKLPIMALAGTMPSMVPPGWILAINCPPRYETNTLLRWISEEHWDYTKGIFKVGLVGRDLPNVEEIKTAIGEYWQAHPDKFEWVGSFLAPAGTMAWSREVEELKDCDYICTTGSPMVTFMKEFRSEGYSATFLGVSAASACRGLLVDQLGYEALDGTLFANESLWWNESTPIVDLAKELLYRVSRLRGS